MKKLIGTGLFAIVLLGPAVVPLLPVCAAQDHDRDRDRRDRDSQDERAYYNNRYYQKGWNDGQHHKHKHKKWKNDADRQAYEAGYAHGDRGEKWNSQRHDDHR
jgi:hypothetical protein